MLTTAKPQVVIDTNVWISGLVFGGNPERIIRLFIEGELLVVSAEELLSELRRKISQRFPLFVPNLNSLEASIREYAILVKLGGTPIAASRDVNDNVFLETALVGKAEYIISGDKDLTDIGLFRDIQILKPAKFLEFFR